MCKRCAQRRCIPHFPVPYGPEISQGVQRNSLRAGVVVGLSIWGCHGSVVPVNLDQFDTLPSQSRLLWRNSSELVPACMKAFENVRAE